MDSTNTPENPTNWQPPASAPPAPERKPPDSGWKIALVSLFLGVFSLTYYGIKSLKRGYQTRGIVCLALAGFGVLLVVATIAASGGSTTTSNPAAVEATDNTVAPGEVNPEPGTPEPVTDEPEPVEPAVEPEPEPVVEAEPEPSEPAMTVAQENALESARSYIESGAFSRKGLIEQLSSEYGEDYSRSDAKYAVKHVGADWKAEAVESAESYMESGSFSRSSLIEQLTSSYGEDFTQAQAEYAVDKVYR